jgi:hypothetical protein
MANVKVFAERETDRPKTIHEILFFYFFTVADKHFNRLTHRQIETQTDRHMER